MQLNQTKNKLNQGEYRRDTVLNYPDKSPLNLKTSRFDAWPRNVIHNTTISEQLRFEVRWIGMGAGRVLTEVSCDGNPIA